MMIIDTRFFKIQELIHREDPAQNDRSFNQDGLEGDVQKFVDFQENLR